MISPPPVINPSVYVETFSEAFRTLDAGPDQTAAANPLHRWRTVAKGGADASSRSTSAATWYGDASDGGPSPFKTGGYGLAITATRQAQPFGRSWRSGFLSTKFSFSQMHGYFEFSANLPTCTPGAWPGLWLLPETTPGWPANGEIDLPETIGDGKVYWTVIDPALNKQQSSPGSCAPGFHTYGVLWRPDTIAFYYDRKLVGVQPTPADYTQPMYLLMDLNVGGGWPGQPDPALRSVQMFVNRVSVWSAP